MNYQERLLRDLTDSLEAAQQMLQCYKGDPKFHEGVLQNIKTQALQAASYTAELIGALHQARQEPEGPLPIMAAPGTRPHSEPGSVALPRRVDVPP